MIYVDVFENVELYVLRAYHTEDRKKYFKVFMSLSKNNSEDISENHTKMMVLGLPKNNRIWRRKGQESHVDTRGPSNNQSGRTISVCSINTFCWDGRF